MERTNFNYSTKNIPIASPKVYTKQLIEKTEQFLRRMRWKAYHLLNPTDSAKETYGFKTTKCPPPIDHMKSFEDGMLKMIQSVQFRNANCEFQQQLKNDINSIKEDDRIFVKADKSTNFYKLDASAYNDLMKSNVTKTYKKTDQTQVINIDKEAKNIAEKLNLDDRIETMAAKESFITLKDHKPNFDNKPTCRLINPAKSEIGLISKRILDSINKEIIKVTNINQWKNTSSVLKWYKGITDKKSASFICFDVVEFYPSITEKLLHDALDFAQSYVNISKDERKIIINAKRSLLFNNNQPWCKRSQSKLFDVTMGSYDGAETCELVGCFLLSKLSAKYGDCIGLYRDDGLAVLKKKPREIEKIKKDICSTFNEYGLRITIEANKKVVNFLDVTLDLNSGSYKPYLKPDNTPQYVHRHSNHPPDIIKNLPKSINRRLTEISSDERIFKDSTPIYQDALKKSGYDYKLEYNPNSTNTKKRNRQRNIIWYNPPFSSNVKTDIGRLFLNLIDKHFTVDNPLRKIFNRNTVKLSYSCMPNVKNIIDSHNKAVINQQTAEQNRTVLPCNCRNKTECPLEGKCRTSNVIYQATVTTENSTETYVGLTENEFKTRYRNHTASFRNQRQRTATELSKYIWNLKDNNTEYNLKWTVLMKSKAYSNISKRCNLCINEKHIIICQPEKASLNKRNELVSACRHRRKYLLRFHKHKM